MGFERIEQLQQPLTKLLSELEIYTIDGKKRPPEDAPLLRSLRGKKLHNIEEVIIHPRNGQKLIRRVSSTPLKNGSDTINGAIAVVDVPAGPHGASGPLLGFIFPETPTEVVIAFARYATDTESQERLVQRALRVPVNVNVNKESYPAIEILFNQAQNAILLPNIAQTPPLRQANNWVYDDVLFGQLDATSAVCQFTQAIKQVTNSDAPSAPVCN